MLRLELSDFILAVTSSIIIPILWKRKLRQR